MTPQAESSRNTSSSGQATFRATTPYSTGQAGFYGVLAQLVRQQKRQRGSSNKA